MAPKGIIAVDLFGMPANFTDIRRIADKYGLFILEDAAQGFGGTYKGKKRVLLAMLPAPRFSLLSLWDATGMVEQFLQIVMNLQKNALNSCSWSGSGQI